MLRRVSFHPAAIEDAEEATFWYAQRSKRAAAVAALPLLRRLSVADDAIDILAVADAKRRPQFWRSRLSN